MTPPPGRPLRVALVLGTSTGGVGRHVRALAAGLAARGVAVTVAGPAAAQELFGFAAAGADPVPVEIASGPRPVADARALGALRRAVRGADVVHAHGLRAGLLAGLATPRATPLVVTWHNPAPAGGAAGPVWARLERAVARRASVTLAASDDLAARARLLGGRDVRPHTVAAPALPPPPGGVDGARAAARAGLGLADGRPLLLTVARLHPQKGLDVLLDAAAAWARRTPPPLVAVAGDGPLAAPLARRVAADGLPVALLGRRDDVPALLAAADVVVLPSRWEARSLVAQEALRAGRPLVATAVGGLPGLLGDAARLVPPDDPGALADAVTGLLDDQAAADALVARGRERAAGWPTEADTVTAVAALYAELTGRPVGVGA